MSQDWAFHRVRTARVLQLLAVERLEGADGFWAPPPCGDSSAAAVNDLIPHSLKLASRISEALPPNLGVGAPHPGPGRRKNYPGTQREGPNSSLTGSDPCGGRGALVDTQRPGRQALHIPRQGDLKRVEGSATPEAVPPSGPGQSEILQLHEAAGPSRKPGLCGP